MYIFWLRARGRGKRINEISTQIGHATQKCLDYMYKMTVFVIELRNMVHESRDFGEKETIYVEIIICYNQTMRYAAGSSAHAETERPRKPLCGTGLWIYF